MKKSWWQKIDYLLVFVVLVLVTFGLIIITSATKNDPSAAGQFNRQLIYFFVGVFFAVIFASFDYQFLAGLEKYFYFFVVGMLLVVMFIGHSALGAQRWIAVGSFTFQPSEFTKIFVILSLAVRLSKEDALKKENLFWTFIYIGVPMILILLQPDLGTALVLMAILFIMLFVRGVNPLFILGFIAAGISASPFILKEYQRQRLLVFLHPESDPTGSGWNIIQSMVAIGSGKFWGKGLFLGTQTQLQFVPEHSTDFIFTVVGEDLGFLGCASVVILFLILLWKMLMIARDSKDLMGTLIATGITSMFFFHIFVNIGMTIGVMPVTGIPLPFFSYGGSALIANMMAIGLLLNISIRKDIFFKKKTL